MFSIYHNAKTERQYSACTGLTKEKFEALALIFKQHYVPKPVNPISKLPAALIDSNEALFFILYYLKTYPTYQVLGVSFGFSDCTAHDYVEYIKPILKHCLSLAEALPYRVFKSQEDFDKAFEGVTDLFIDGTEVVVQRNAIYEIQQKDFSGKKKNHTVLFLMICDKNARIVFLGRAFVGSVVDFKAFKEELGDLYYHEKVLHVDLGFVGIDKNLKLQEGENRETTIRVRGNMNIEATDITHEVVETNTALEIQNTGVKNISDINVSATPSKLPPSGVSNVTNSQSENKTTSTIIINIPHKKKRVKKGEPKFVLSDTQKRENKILASQRIIVEHCIGGTKRNFILRHENRTKDRQKLDDSMELCVGLWNFRKGFKNNMPKKPNETA